MTARRGSMSAEVAVLVPALFLLVVLAVGRGRVFDVGITLRGAADVAARTASLSAVDRMVGNGRRAAIAFVDDARVPCRGVIVEVDLEESGGYVYVVAKVACSVDHRDIGGLLPRVVRVDATSREIVDYYRSDR